MLSEGASMDGSIIAQTAGDTYGMGTEDVNWRLRSSRSPVAVCCSILVVDLVRSRPPDGFNHDEIYPKSTLDARWGRCSCRRVEASRSMDPDRSELCRTHTLPFFSNWAPSSSISTSLLSSLKRTKAAKAAALWPPSLKGNTDSPRPGTTAAPLLRGARRRAPPSSVTPPTTAIWPWLFPMQHAGFRYRRQSPTRLGSLMGGKGGQRGTYLK